MSAWAGRIRWGVIDDARSHQHRRRRHGLGLALVAIIIALVAYAAFGGDGRARFAVPAPGVVTGSLQPLSPSSYQLYATPGLFPGKTTLTIDTQFTSGGGDGGGQAVYPGAGVPIIPPAPLGLLQANTSPVAQDEVLVVAANVAAVRVGNLGTVGARSVSGLPTGDKLVAFRLRPSAHAKPFPSPRDPQAARAYQQAARLAPALSLKALDSAGHPLTSANTNRASLADSDEPATIVPYAQLSAQAEAAQRALDQRLKAAMTTSGGGRCAVATGLIGYQHLTVALRTVTPLPQNVPGLFLSCLEDNYIYRGAIFNIAVLLNAHHPGSRPAALWNARPVTGHPGIFEISPPPDYSPTLQTATPVPGHIGLVEIKESLQLPGFIDDPTPLIARRIPGAWLVEQAAAKVSGRAIVRKPTTGKKRSAISFPTSSLSWRYPDFAEQVQVLKAFDVTRLDLGHR